MTTCSKYRSASTGGALSGSEHLAGLQGAIGVFVFRVLCCAAERAPFGSRCLAGFHAVISGCMSNISLLHCGKSATKLEIAQAGTNATDLTATGVVATDASGATVTDTSTNSPATILLQLKEEPSKSTEWIN